MNNIYISVKPLSVNDAWQGKRFKSPKYKQYEKIILALLPNDIYIQSKKKLSIHIDYFFSNSASDIDNPTKMILDILSKKYNFNDNLVYRLELQKAVVAKEKEWFYIQIRYYE